MKIQGIRTIVMAAAFVAGTALPTSALAGNTDECGPMCHRPATWHQSHGKGWYGLGARQGSFQDMKHHFGIGPEQEAAWARFQKAVMDRMVAAFDAENLTQEHLTTPPEAFDQETFAPILSDELIKKWQNVLTTYEELQAVLDKDRKKVAQRIKTICKQVE